MVFVLDGTYTDILDILSDLCHQGMITQKLGLDKNDNILYGTHNMLNLINLTQARNNLSRLVEEVFSAKKTYILIRDSIPQAVIIPYDQYLSAEEKWQETMNKLMEKGKKTFKDWLAKNKKRYPKTEDETYEIINQLARRN